MPPSRETKRIILVSSSGGVLLDLLAIKPWWSRYDASWVAVRAADTISVLAGMRVHWIKELSFRRPQGLLLDSWRAWRILRREQPQLVVSAGTGCAVPFFLAARILGIPTFWISTLNVLTVPGKSATMCARVASRVILQKASMLRAHPGAVVIGELY